MIDKYFLAAHTKGKNEEAREIYALASQGIVDRDKEIIRWNAWVGGLTDFLKHPILLVGHNYGALWVARVTSIDPRRDGLVFTAKFATTPEAEEAWTLIKETDTAAFSVGFKPIDSQMIAVRNLDPAERASALRLGMAEAEQIRVYTRVKLLEISLVSVPSCPTALLQAWKSKAIKTEELREAMQGWQAEIDLAEIGSKIDGAVKNKIAQMNLPGLITAAIKERVREEKNERWRQRLLAQIMDGYRQNLEAQKKVEARQRAVAALPGEIDLDNPEQVEAFIKAHLGGVDMEGLVGNAVRLTIDRARGRVY